MNFRLFLAVEWGRAVGVKLEWGGLEGASPCTLILEVRGQPPSVVRKWRIGAVYPTIIFFGNFQRHCPCNIFVVVLEEF
jgi:hypothetical protein